MLYIKQKQILKNLLNETVEIANIIASSIITMKQSKKDIDNNLK